MTAASSTAVVRRWFQAFNDRDMAAEQAIRAPGFVAHVSGMPAPLTNPAWDQFITGFATGFPDFRLDVDEIVTEGDRVAVRWSFSGTHQGAFLGVQATGRRVMVSAMEVNHVVGEQVVEHWVMLDLLSLLQQLGAAPTPG